MEAFAGTKINAYSKFNFFYLNGQKMIEEFDCTKTDVYSNFKNCFLERAGNIAEKKKILVKP